MARFCSYSRRSFLVGGLTLAGGAGGLLLADRNASLVREKIRHQGGPPTQDPPSSETLATLVSYLGAFFGQDFSDEDHRELTSRLTFAATRDSGWAKEYESGAAFLDDLAVGYGSDSYALADRETQVAVIHDLRQPLRGPLAKIRLGAFDAARARERMRVSTSRHLIRLYRRSGVPWRRRGFDTWPGVADQLPAYDRLKSG